MPIEINPANTDLSKDFANYQKEFKAHPETKKEIKKHLHQKNSAKYSDWDPANPNKDDAVFLGLDAFGDFAFSGTTTTDRLGGKLDPSRPGGLNNIPNPTPGAQFPFSRNHDNPPPVPPFGTVRVRAADGAILHNPIDVPLEEDRDASDHYMHHVFDDILYETRDLLEQINIKLTDYVANPSKVTRDAYAVAVMDFDDFRATLKTGTTKNTYSQAFNWVTIEPVKTNEGYIVSARVEVNWKNPYHSSSTIRVP